MITKRANILKKIGEANVHVPSMLINSLAPYSHRKTSELSIYDTYTYYSWLQGIVQVSKHVMS
jgi:hypothetical protein